MLRSGAILVVLASLALGPIYAGADARPTITAARHDLRVAAIDRRPARVRPRQSRPAVLPPERIVREVDVARGDTLGSLLADAGLDAADAARWSAAVARVLDPRRLRIGHTVTVEHDAAGVLAALRYEIDDTATLVVERRGDVLAVRRETTPGVVELRGVAGTVERGLWSDVVAAGAPAAVASDLAKILGGEVDFRRVSPGDEFRVLYEVETRPAIGVEVPGGVVGAEVRIGGRLVTAIRFTDRRGRDGYYAPDGDALGRMMLRYPLEFTRISSGFSYHRFHPILHRFRPHLGVDFAAPRGTPVRATADGIVVTAGWKRGMGRMVRLRHGRDLETFYGHLDRVAAGVRSGRRVRQGEIVGYVGATGLATGNHLHYGVRRRGRFVNPLGLGAVRSAALAAPDRGAFEDVRAAVTGELARLVVAPRPTVVSLVSAAPGEG